MHDLLHWVHPLAELDVELVQDHFKDVLSALIQTLAIVEQLIGNFGYELGEKF